MNEQQPRPLEANDYQDSSELRRQLVEGGVMSYKQALETPNALLAGRLADAELSAEKNLQGKVEQEADAEHSFETQEKAVIELVKSVSRLEEYINKLNERIAQLEQQRGTQAAPNEQSTPEVAPEEESSETTAGSAETANDIPEQLDVEALTAAGLTPDEIKMIAQARSEKSSPLPIETPSPLPIETPTPRLVTPAPRAGSRAYAPQGTPQQMRDYIKNKQQSNEAHEIEEYSGLDDIQAPGEKVQDIEQGDVQVEKGEKPKNLSPTMDELEARDTPEGEKAEEQKKRNWFMRKVDWLGAKFGKAKLDIDEAKSEAHDEIFKEYIGSVATKDERHERFTTEAKDKLGDDASDKDVAKYAREKERKYQRSIGNTGWNHLKNLSRVAGGKIDRKDFKSDEEYDNAKSHKRKVIIGAVALGTPVVLAGALMSLRVAGAFDNEPTMSAQPTSNLGDIYSDSLSDVEGDLANLGEGAQDDAPEVMAADNEGLMPALSGEFTAENIGDVDYDEFSSLDKLTATSIGLEMDMSSIDTAMDDMWERAQNGPDHSAQMALAGLTDAQLEDLGLDGMTPQEMEQALHDNELRAEVLNELHDSIEAGEAEIEVVEGFTGEVYNWGARPIYDGEGNIVDTELIQSNLYLENHTLLRFTDADGNTSYFNPDCKNYITEIPVETVPVVQVDEAPPVVSTTPETPYVPTEYAPPEPEVPPVTPPESPPETPPTTPPGTPPESPPETPPTTPPGTPPESPPETEIPPVPPELNPKIPEQDINVNEDLPEQLQMGDDRVDSGPYQPEESVTLPPRDITDPIPEPYPNPAPEATPIDPAERQEEVGLAPEAEGANSEIDPDRQDELYEEGAGELEDGVGNDGRVEP